MSTTQEGEKPQGTATVRRNSVDRQAVSDAALPHIYCTHVDDNRSRRCPSVGPLIKSNDTDAASPTYQQCYWDLTLHDWDNPNACYVEGEVFPLPYPDDIRTASISVDGNNVFFEGNLVPTIMSMDSMAMHPSTYGNRYYWDTSAGRDGKPPNACYVPITQWDPDTHLPSLEWKPNGAGFTASITPNCCLFTVNQ